MSSKEELHSTITARAELDRAFARLLIEDVAEVMSKNLVSLLQVIEHNHAEIMALLGVNADTVKKLESRMSDSEADRADLRARLVRIEDTIAARPALREQEHRALVDEIVARLEARDGE